MVGAPSSQWIACSAARSGGRGRPLNRIVRALLEGGRMSNRHRAAAAIAMLAAMPQPCLAEPPAGAYVAYFTLPILIVWVAGYVFFALSGDIYRRIGLALVSIPVTFLAYSACAMAIGLLGLGNSVFPPIIAAVLIGFLPVPIFFDPKSYQEQHRDEAP
jgi:hypothetical protein